MLSVLIVIVSIQSCPKTCGPSQPAGYAVQAVSSPQFDVPRVASACTQFTQNACSGAKAKPHRKFKKFKCR